MPIAVIENISKVGTIQYRIWGVFVDSSDTKIPFTADVVARNDKDLVDQLRVQYKLAREVESTLNKIMPGTQVDISEPVVIPPTDPVPPTEFEQARLEFYKRAAVLGQYKSFLSVGHKSLTDQQTLVDELFKPEYVTGE